LKAIAFIKRKTNEKKENNHFSSHHHSNHCGVTGGDRSSLYEQVIMAYKKSFEEGLIEMEANSKSLEDGDLSLSEALAVYKQSMELLNFCGNEIKQTKQKIQVLDYETSKLIDVNPESVIGPRNKKS